MANDYYAQQIKTNATKKELVNVVLITTVVLTVISAVIVLEIANA